MFNKHLASASIAFLVTGSAFAAGPASALTTAECGGTPFGGTLIVHDDYCEVYWDSAGTYSWTAPDNLSEIWGIIAGGGGGGGGRADFNEAFAGDGGSMNYLAYGPSPDLGDMVITVGAGGQSSTSADAGSDGEWTTIQQGSNFYGVPGGDGNGPNTANFGTCGSEIAGYTFGEGSHVDGTATPDGTCIGGEPGFIPAEDHADNSLLNSNFHEYGKGGGVYINTERPTSEPGQGAQVVYTDSDGAVIDEFGSDGYAAFYFRLSAETAGSGEENLAATGLDAVYIGFSASALALSGLAITSIAALRRRHTR